MKITRTNTLILNGAAVLVVAVAAVTGVRSLFASKDAPPCSGRYEQGLQMSLDQAGLPLSGSDLEARFSGQDWGLRERARVVKTASAEHPLALEVDVRRKTSGAAGAQGSDERPGVGFVWDPSSGAKPQAACLAYALFLPEGLDFGQRGRLPGLGGGKNTAAPDDDAAFSVLPSWHGPSGAGGALAQFPQARERSRLDSTKAGFTFPRGHWVSVEQEVVLNTPGQADGLVRLWLDGEMVMENTGVTLRKDAATRITGVTAEATVLDARAEKPDAQKILMSPFTLRWN
jgi:hypothetical protein